jgi:hypothetical protein
MSPEGRDQGVERPGSTVSEEPGEAEGCASPQDQGRSYSRGPGKAHPPREDEPTPRHHEEVPEESGEAPPTPPGLGPLYRHGVDSSVEVGAAREDPRTRCHRPRATERSAPQPSGEGGHWCQEREVAAAMPAKLWRLSGGGDAGETVASPATTSE